MHGNSIAASVQKKFIPHKSQAEGLICRDSRSADSAERDDVRCFLRTKSVRLSGFAACHRMNWSSILRSGRSGSSCCMVVDFHLHDVVPKLRALPPSAIAYRCTQIQRDIVMASNRIVGSCLVCFAYACSLSGCATILSDRKYEVTVDNKGGPTYFTVRDRKNQVVESGITPQQVTLDASSRMFQPAKYRVDYAGQDGVQTRELNAKVDPWIAGNIVVGGVPGLIVDGATGAMWRLDPRIVGQVPSQMVVSDTTQGAAILAGHSVAPGPTAGNPLDSSGRTDVRQASFGAEK